MKKLFHKDATGHNEWFSSILPGLLTELGELCSGQPALLQDVLIDVWLSGPNEFTGAEEAVNRIYSSFLRQRRRDATRYEPVDGTEDIPVYEEPTDEHMDVEAILSTLPEDWRTFAWYRWYEGRTQQEVASVYGVSQMQISRWERYCKQLIRDNV